MIPPKHLLIMGMHTVQEALKHTPQRIQRVYLAETKDDIWNLCKKQKIPVEQVSSARLKQLTGSDSHQGIVAFISEHKFWDVKEFLQKQDDSKPLFFLMLSHIMDPQNFGALIRTAECFGVDGVVWSKNRGCDLTPTVAKSACGATEWLPLLRVSNLVVAAEQFREAGFEIVASVADPKAHNLYHHRYNPRTVLIMGSEGEGIQPLLQKQADHLLTIPLQGKVASLNVAQAAAVFLSWKEAPHSL